MAPLLYRQMKGVRLFCTSPASTSACTGVEPRRRPVGRGWCSIPHLRREQRRALNWMPHPQKSEWGSGNTDGLLSPTASCRYLLGEDGGEAFSDDYPDLDTLPAWIPVNSARFHSVTGNDDSAALKPSPFASSSSSSSSSAAAAALPSARFQTGKGHDDAAAGERSFTVARSQGHVSFGVSSSSGLGLRATRDEDSAVPKPSCSSRSQDQVVVLRVSLHCKGCEGKVRKHISRMEGVTSFNIDFDTKKVTVVGNVTLLGVLSSISKVKNAQFWTSP